MFRSCLFSLVLAVVLLFMLMSLPLALSEAQSRPASAGTAPPGDEAHAAPSPAVTPAAEEVSPLPALPSGRQLRPQEAFLLGAVLMSAFALLVRRAG